MIRSLTVPGVNWTAIAPEAVLTAGALVVLLVGSGLRRKGHLLLSSLSLIVIVVAAAFLIPAVGRSEVAFAGSIALDGFATFLKFSLLAAAAIAVIASYTYLDRETSLSTEYFGLMLLATAGMILMTSALDLIMVFIALETFSLALYVLAAFRRDRLDSQEGALKYFLSGSFASAFLLYGIALVYGGAGSTRFLAISQQVSTGGANSLVVAGLALIMVGLAFKVAAVPFHMWTPDAYEGSPSPVAGFMAAGSKVAAFAVLLRFLVSALPSMADVWQPPLALLAVITMALGSVVAVAQTNVKRMLAYSAIAHSGFLLIGVIAANERGISGSLFYLATYAAVIIGCFAIAYGVGMPADERVNLQDYRGLWTTQPFAAVTLAILLVSLAGIPPTAGFIAKFEVFAAGISAGYAPLVVVAVLASAVAAFFYLRVIVLMFLQSPPEWSTEPRSTPPMLGVAAVAAVAIVAVFGLFPAPLLEWARDATLLFR